MLWVGFQELGRHCKNFLLHLKSRQMVPRASPISLLSVGKSLCYTCFYTGKGVSIMMSSRNLQGVGGDDTELNKIDGKREKCKSCSKRFCIVCSIFSCNLINECRSKYGGEFALLYKIQENFRKLEQLWKGLRS